MVFHMPKSLFPYCKLKHEFELFCLPEILLFMLKAVMNHKDINTKRPWKGGT